MAMWIARFDRTSVGDNLVAIQRGWIKQLNGRHTNSELGCDDKLAELLARLLAGRQRNAWTPGVKEVTPGVLGLNLRGGFFVR